MGKPYDKEFKLQTIRMIQDEGKPVAQVARELGINDNICTAGWRNTSGADSTPSQEVGN